MKNNSEDVLIRNESIFNQKFKIEKLVKAIFGKEHRLKWDPMLQKIEIIPGENKAFFQQYVLNKKILTYAPREFHEKVFSFSNNETYYRMSSSVF